MARALVAVAAIAVAGTGCWIDGERAMMEREATMEHHLTALFDASQALSEGDERRYRDAMKELERGGELPGVPAGAELAALHAAAREAGRRSESARDRADGLSAVVGLCDGCHQANGAIKPAFVDARSPVEAATFALVWRDEATWTTAAADLRLTAPSSWEDRRRALRHHLGGSP